MTIDRKIKTHKILLRCLVAFLSTIILVNALLLYLFIPITPLNNEPNCWNTKKFSDTFYKDQITRKELLAMRQPFASKKSVLSIIIRINTEAVTTAKRPIWEDHENFEEKIAFQEKYDREMAIYEEKRNSELIEAYKAIFKTYELDAIPFFYNCYHGNNVTSEIRFYIPDTITISTYRQYVEKLETIGDDPRISYVSIFPYKEDDYWTKNYLPGETLFE